MMSKVPPRFSRAAVFPSWRVLFVLRMEISTLVRVLDEPHVAADALQAWRLQNVPRAQQILLELAETGLTLDLLAALCEQLGEFLAAADDPDATLAALGRYLFAVRSPLSLGALLDRDPAAMPMLLAALSLGPQWAEYLAEDPEAFDLLRESGAGSVSRENLIAEAQVEADAFADEDTTVAALSRLRRRHLLRIAYGEVSGRKSPADVAGELTSLGEAMVEVALAVALRRVRENEQGRGARVAGTSGVRCAVIAAGNLGGREASYALPLELLLVYDPPKGGNGAVASAAEHFERVARSVRRLLGDAGCQVQFLSLPDSQAKLSAHAADDCVVGFDSFGRTWHRGEMVKARPIAGDLALGEEEIGRAHV